MKLMQKVGIYFTPSFPIKAMKEIGLSLFDKWCHKASMHISVYAWLGKPIIRTADDAHLHLGQTSLNLKN